MHSGPLVKAPDETDTSDLIGRGSFGELEVSSPIYVEGSTAGWLLDGGRERGISALGQGRGWVGGPQRLEGDHISRGPGQNAGEQAKTNNNNQRPTDPFPRGHGRKNMARSLSVRRRAFAHRGRCADGMEGQEAWEFCASQDSGGGREDLPLAFFSSQIHSMKEGRKKKQKTNKTYKSMIAITVGL